MLKGSILSLGGNRRLGGKPRPVRALLHAGALGGLFIAGAGAVLGPANDTRADGAPDQIPTAMVPDIPAETEVKAPEAAAAPVAPTPAPKEVAAPTPAVDAQVAMLTGPAPAVRQIDTHRSLTVRSGDTLMKLLVKAGVPRNQGHAAIVALRKVYNPRSILPGQKITVTMRPGAADDAPATLREIALRANVERDVMVRLRDDGSFKAGETKRELRTKLVRGSGTVKSSLYVAGRRAGLPPAILIEMMRIYSWDVDFQRDMQSGDGFDVVFERLTTESGEKVRDGKIVYASLRLGKATHRFYRFVDKRGRAGYFDENGQSAKKPLLRTPVDGARLTSRYGRRRHPVLRYTRMHRGVDFAAQRGTPVFAAGNGRIVYRGRKGAFGKYIKIRHNSQYATAYAHLRSFRRGVTSGSRVKQGQIIGYVGSTGTATGPHLHFEVLVGGRQVNPLRVRLPSGRKLKGKQLAAFQAMRGTLASRLADLRTPGIKVSSN